MVEVPRAGGRVTADGSDGKRNRWWPNEARAEECSDGSRAEEPSPGVALATAAATKGGRYYVGLVEWGEGGGSG